MNLQEPISEPPELETWEIEGPSLDYYIGYGNLDRGISTVIYSSEFYALLTQSPYAMKFLPSMDHHSCTISDTLSPQVQNSAVALMMEVPTHLKAITGFSYTQLDAKKNRLERKYRGQSTAPFSVELY